MEQQESITLTRRRAVTVGAAAAAGAVGVAGLTACGGSSSAATDDAGSSAAASAGSGAATSSAAAGSSALAKLSDVPVGGVLVVKDSAGAPLVLAQPSAGTVVGFSGKCPHQGCAVAADGKGGLKCPCHGSTFDATGAVLTGPATTALSSVAVTVDGEDVVAG